MNDPDALTGAPTWERIFLLLGDTWSSGPGEVAMKATTYSDLGRELRAMRARVLDAAVAALTDDANAAFWSRLDAFFSDWTASERRVLNEALEAALRALKGDHTHD